MFELDPRLAADTFEVLSWPLSSVLLMNDSRYPWLILVPARTGVVELTDLGADDRLQLMRESMAATEYLKGRFNADKMNVASLGNVVAQLHVHHVARFHHDDAWPAPVWGRGAAVPYDQLECSELLKSLREGLPAL